jgi:hypothetical protein
MEKNKTKLLIGIGIGVALYFAFRFGLKNVFVKKDTGKKNFANADGDLVGNFVAKQYDANHLNTDGTMGATWISYEGSDIVGYWQKGKIEEGTDVSLV